jgi:hypothetical protein
VAKAGQAIKAIVAEGSHCGHSLPSKSSKALQPQPAAEGSHSKSFLLIQAIGRSQPFEVILAIAAAACSAAIRTHQSHWLKPAIQSHLRHCSRSL